MVAKLKNKKQKMDMTNGPLWNKIIIFAVPIMLTTLMQQLFHSVDMAVVGKFVGKNELAAVGSNGSIINLLLNIFMGFSAGSGVVIAQLLGGKKLKTAKKAISTSLIIAMVGGIAVLILGVSFSRTLLFLISSPPEVIDLATTYLRIYFLGAPFILVYNFSSSILRSRGETTKPFYCLLVSGALNVVLNLLFVIVFKWSVAGVAISTTLSNGVSCIMVLKIIMGDKSELEINPKEIKWDKFIFSRIFKIGLPMSIQSSLFPLSNMLIQSSINSLGTSVIAASAASQSIENYSYCIMGGFNQANVTFMGQNFGARNIKRCKKVFYLCLLLNFVTTLSFNLIMLAFSDVIVNLFTSDPEVALLTRQRLTFMYYSFTFMIFMNSFSDSLKGLGYSFVPTLVSLIGVCGIRILWVFTVFKQHPTFETILAVYPICWILVSLVLIIPFFIILKKLSKKYPIRTSQNSKS